LLLGEVDLYDLCAVVMFHTLSIAPCRMDLSKKTERKIIKPAVEAKTFATPIKLLEI
jgi:hypothetical protein